MCGLYDVNRLLCLRFLPPLSGVERRERALEWWPVEEAVGHGRPRGSGDQAGLARGGPTCPILWLFHVRDTHVVIEATGKQYHEERICLSLGTVYYSLFGGDSVLESLINLNLNTSLSFLLFRTVPSNDLLGLGEIGPDGLRLPDPSGS